MAAKKDFKADVVIVGGGLTGCLTALKIKTAKPQTHIVLIEEGARLGGHGTWDFQESDLPGAESLDWLRPLIAKSWDESSVRFPKAEKTFKSKHHAIRSENLHAELIMILGEDAHLKKRAARLSESHVELETGEIYSARLVIDTRGLRVQEAPKTCGFRKFIGQEFELEEPHGLSGAILMDCDCPQIDGLRFFQVFPWGERRIFVQEVFYSDSPLLNPERIHRSLASYAERHGWKIKSVEREETAALLIPMTSETISNSIGGEALPLGARGGYFHATTGFTLPDAVRIAEFLSKLEDLTTSTAREGLVRFRRSWLSRQRYYRLINRIIFYASEASLRYQVLENFYSLPEETITRFTAGKTSWSDRARIFSNRPEIPFDRVLKCFTEKAIQLRGGGSAKTAMEA